MVETTLKQIDVWYSEPSQGGDRAKLLSKLALLELCGWIETEIDRLIIKAGKSCRIDEKWVIDSIVAPNHGFSYPNHMRDMFGKLFGEVFNLKVEAEMELKHPGDLETLKSLLGTLYKKRNSSAHTHVAGVQITYDAPSWSINQYRLFKKNFLKYESCIDNVINTINS